AGVPAPRATFAHVRVNGESFGLYAAIEPMDEVWVARNYVGEGDLWEANDSADLTSAGISHFDLAAGDGDVTDLAAVSARLAEAVVDFDDVADDVIETDSFLDY